MKWKFLQRKRANRELEDEIKAHLDLETQSQIEAGESPAAARAAALRDLGNLTLIKEVTREMWGYTWLERVIQDARYAARTLSKSPGFTLLTVATLALGIGATSTIFTVVNSVLLRPLPFPEPDRLVMIWERPPKSDHRNVANMYNFAAWRERNRSFEAIAAFNQLPMNLLIGAEPEQVNGLVVTGAFFRALGAAPLLGRTLAPNEDGPAAPRVTVLSYGLWQRRFGGRADIIGQKISINVSHHEIIGVMPPGFSIPGRRAELYIPLRASNDEGRNYSIIARMRPGSTPASAQAEMNVIAAQTAKERPQINAGWGATVVPLLEQTVGQIRPVLLMLFAAVGFVLLIACSNVANLLLMRSARRGREMSIRIALGAGRARILQQLLIESVLLAAIGGALGVALAEWGVHVLVRTLPAAFSLPRLNEIRIDPIVLLFTAAVALSAGVLFGLAPAFESKGIDPARGLHLFSRSNTARRGVRDYLVVAEVALALLLVTGAGLMMRSFERLNHVEPGFHAEHVVTLRMLLLPVKNRAFHAQTVDEILRRVRALPQVVGAGSIGVLPMSGGNSGTWYYRADRPQPAAGDKPGGDVSIVTPGYFQAMGIPLLGGRDFEDRDRLGSPHVAILNQAAARLFYQDEDPLGKSMAVWWNDAGNVRVVGVVADIRHAELSDRPQPCLFMPNAQQPFPFASLVVRTAGDPLSLVPAITEQIRRVDADQGVAEIHTMEDLVANSIARPRVQTMLMGLFGLLALTLASIGIYGVISYSVTQRTREIGIRLAIGALPAAIFSAVFKDGIRLTGFGLGIGLGAALGLTRYMRSLLFEVQPADPLVFAGVTGLLLLVAMAACYIPAARATRVDPAVVLREE
jgi:putative ABC transport system permease protein